jgi:DsbC/DsbD-like thiol-disulfide interchange protein
MLKRSSLVVTGVSMLLLSACNFQTPQSARQETQSPDKRDKVPRVPKSTPPIATTEADSPVTAAAKPDPARVRAGEAFTVVVDVHISKGWHIYAIDRPTGPALPTSITLDLPKGLTWDGNWTSPEPSLDQSSLGAPNFVHERAVAFQRRVRVGRDISPGPRPLRGMLHFQACDRYACRAPAQLSLQTEIDVAH